MIVEVDLTIPVGISSSDIFPQGPMKIRHSGPEPLGFTGVPRVFNSLVNLRLLGSVVRYVSPDYGLFQLKRDLAMEVGECQNIYLYSIHTRRTISTPHPSHSQSANT
jgi:hypothetical protein